jgi:hypothetical protein
MATAPTDTKGNSELETDNQAENKNETESPYRRDNWWYDESPESPAAEQA